MTRGQNKVIHGLLAQLTPANQLSECKADFANTVSQGRTNKTSELTAEEAATLINSLKQERDRRTKPMRGKIIHLLCLMGYTHEDGEADFDRINNFVKNIGKNNPKKKVLYWLTIKETLAVLNQVEAIYKKSIKDDD
jgi:hypothetical protein